MNTRELRLAQARMRAAATHVRQQTHLAPGTASTRAALLAIAEWSDETVQRLAMVERTINVNLAAVRRVRRAA